MFIHYVNFWLKAGSSSEVQQKLVNDCRTILSAVPGVQHIWAGPPAMTPRDVVDNSYDVGLCIVFPDKAAHDVYQTHPMHDEFIGKNKSHWERVVVRDFIA